MKTQLDSPFLSALRPEHPLPAISKTKTLQKTLTKNPLQKLLTFSFSLLLHPLTSPTTHTHLPLSFSRYHYLEHYTYHLVFLPRPSPPRHRSVLSYACNFFLNAAMYCAAPSVRYSEWPARACNSHLSANTLPT